MPRVRSLLETAMYVEDPERSTRWTRLGISVESRVRWKRGGTSLCFRDPDGHLVELVSPGTWKIF